MRYKRLKNCTLNLLLFFVSADVFANQLYNGGVSVYDDSSNYIALHKHGAEYSLKERRFIPFSFIELIDKRLSYSEAIRIENTSKLNALKWSDDERFLVGISNIPLSGNPSIIVYNQKGKLVTTKKMSCREDSLFCSDDMRLFWYYVTINSLDVKARDDYLEVYIQGRAIIVDI